MLSESLSGALRRSSGRCKTMRFTLIVFLILLGPLSARSQAEDRNFHCWLVNELQQIIPLKHQPIEISGALTFSGFDELSGIETTLRLNIENKSNEFQLIEAEKTTGKVIRDPRQFGPWNKAITITRALAQSGFAGEYICGSNESWKAVRDTASRRAPLYAGDPDLFYKVRAQYFKDRGLIDDYFIGDVDHRKKIEVPSESLVLVTHAEAQFDQGRTKKDLTSFLSAVDTSRMPAIALTTGLAFNVFTSNIDKRFVSSVMHSHDGSHGLVFPKAKTIVVAGGFLEQCLCETLEGVIRGAPNNLTIVIPLELVYFQKWKAIVDLFRDQLSTSSGYGEAVTLRELKQKSFSDETYSQDLWRAFEVAVLGQNNTGSSSFMCPHQPDGKMSIDRFTINAYLQDGGVLQPLHKLGSVGHGMQELNFVFAGLHEALEKLNSPRN